MVSNFKNTKEDITIEEEIKRFIHLLGIDKTIHEVNFHHREIRYKTNGCDISITFKTK